MMRAHSGSGAGIKGMARNEKVVKGKARKHVEV
jgi:hypothetical protein